MGRGCRLRGHPFEVLSVRLQPEPRAGAHSVGSRAGLADADLIIVDDGAGGTEKSSAMSRVKTYVADVTLTTGTQAALTTLAGLSITSHAAIFSASRIFLIFCLFNSIQLLYLY